MGQLILKFGDIREPLSSNTRLRALGRRHLDPEVRSSLLFNTLHRQCKPVGGHHMQPITGADLQSADGACLTWKYVAATDNIPVLPPPTRGPAISDATTSLEGTPFLRRGRESARRLCPEWRTQHRQGNRST